MNFPIRGFLLIISCIFFLGSFPQTAHGLSVVVRASKEQCFTEELLQYERLKASFIVVSGGSHDIDLTVFGPEEDIVFQQTRISESSFQFIARISGVYRICFGNKMSTISNKVVSFNIYSGDRLQHHESATGEGVSKLEEGVRMLQEGLNSVRDSTDYLRYRQVRCAKTARSTNRRFFWWKIVHTMVLMAAAGLQVFYITSLFTRGKGLSGAMSAATGFASSAFSSGAGSSTASTYRGPAASSVTYRHGYGASTDFSDTSSSPGRGGFDQRQRYSALGGNPFD